MPPLSGGMEIDMILIIASDIHGSACFCRLLLDAYKKEGAEHLLLLGDILYHGPRNDLPGGHDPKEVVRMLNEMARNITCVRGNCDAEVDEMVLDFSVLEDYQTLIWEGKQIFATHGHLWNEQMPPRLPEGSILACGHTHIPACNDHGSFLFINPGSVSLPKGGSARSYIVFDGKELLFKDLETGSCYHRHQL